MSEKKPIVYVAGPYGFSEAGRLFHYEKLLPMLSGLGFELRDPWSLTPPEVLGPVLAMPFGIERREAWRKVNVVIGRNNERAIQESNLVVAVLDGTDVDSGTAAEIGYAYAHGKLVVGYRGDFRQSADNDGGLVNLQVEYFVRQSGGEIFTSLEDLRKWL